MEQALGALTPLWDKIAEGFAHGEPPAVSVLQIVIIALVAAAVSIPPLTWKIFGLFVTVVHELGHVGASIMTGRFITGIRLRFDHSGTTMSYGKLGGAGMIWSTFWGYPVPAVVGAVLVWATLAGWASFALSVSALLLLATLLGIRNLQGLLIILCTAGASLGLVWFAAPDIIGHVTLALGIALLVGAVRDWVKIVNVHRSRPEDIETSDAHILQQATGLPAPVWLGLYASTILGAWLGTVTVVAREIVEAGALH
jgi:hypothetical protein